MPGRIRFRSCGCSPARAAQRANARDVYVPAQNDADHAAAAWATEMTALETAAEAMADRQIAWADFDAMLRDMERELARVAAFFNFTAHADRIRATRNRAADEPLFEGARI